MKYLLVLAVVAVALWLLVRPRVRGSSSSQARRGADAPVEMIACAHCGVHLPRDDAVTDAGARRYCSEAHRALGPR